MVGPKVLRAVGWILLCQSEKGCTYCNVYSMSMSKYIGVAKVISRRSLEVLLYSAFCLFLF